MSKKRKDIVSSSVPEAFIKKMEALLGSDETSSLVSSLNDAPSVSIRINRAKVKDPDKFVTRFEEFGVSKVPWCKSGYYLDHRADFIHDPLLHAGTYYVQEAASMIYEAIIEGLPEVKAGSPIKVLDLCGAPGGKSTAILNAFQGPHILVANELEPSRSKILKENLEKWGDPAVIVTNSAATKFRSLKGIFDIVAVDAPCSGEGMMRREPIARTQWSENLVEQCSKLQKDILSDAYEALKPGGVLIYSTCTFNKEENEENIKWLLESFSLEPQGEPQHFYPHKQRCEGLFVAVFRKSEELDEYPGINSNILSFQRFAERLKKAGIKIIGTGIEKIITKGALTLPSSKMCLASDFDRTEYPSIELSKEEALDYIRRKPLMLQEDLPTGFIVVLHEGYPLGLVKNIGKRANNLFPSEWRVVS